MDSKTKLIQSAIKIFSQNGYEATSVDSIVEKAGVAKGTFYYYFKSKEELFWAIIDEGTTKFTELIKESLREVKTKEDKVKKIIETEIDFFEQYQDFAHMFLAEFWRFKTKWSKDIEKAQKGYLSIISNSIDTDLDKEIASAALFWTGAFMTMDWIYFRNKTTKKDLVNNITSLLIKGV